MKKLLISAFLTFCTTLSLWSQSVTSLPPLHVEGKWLVDDSGQKVVLHGVMDTPNAYFNGGRWGWNYDMNGVNSCLKYFDKLFVGLAKANCDVFRLHLDPAWTNDPNKKSDGKESGEADISRFSESRLGNFLGRLYIPLMEKALAQGLYVVVRPPGVCPHNLKVGDYYQQYLMTVWDIVSKRSKIQQYAGQISLELANEPVNLKDANGKDNARALHDYFQPIVDKIRENGFTGIIWIPGTGYQSRYESYKSYPITGDNIGYAVHDYQGWYNCNDESANAQNKINAFHSQVPVVDTKPVIITEVDWSPVKEPKEVDHVNEFGQTVYKNLGTWATGTTSRWGKAFKTMLDHFGNISMTLSGTGCLIDIDRLLSDGSVVPAFNGNPEACGKACMDWYAEYKHPTVIGGFGKEITSMADIVSGKAFVIGNGSSALYFDADQNAVSAPVTQLPSGAYYYYTLTKIAGYDDVFAVNIVNKDGTAFPAPYGLGNNLNVSQYGGVIFSGSAQADKAKGYGTDGKNWGIWQITYVTGQGFAFKNVGRGLYMNLTTTQEEPIYMTLYEDIVKSDVPEPSAVVTPVSDVSMTVKGLYNLKGQRLQRPVKGLNIINGKKVLVR